MFATQNDFNRDDCIGVLLVLCIVFENDTEHALFFVCRIEVAIKIN